MDDNNDDNDNDDDDNNTSNTNKDTHFSVQLNEFFKKPVPESIQNAVAIQYQEDSKTASNKKKNDDSDDSVIVEEDETNNKEELDFVSIVTAAPSCPGFPRPLWVVVLASIPTGLVWYGYYKFVIEEELLRMELDAHQTPKGLGGYGTLGPFTYGMVLGPMADLLHIPGGWNWSAVGIIFIYYTQFLLYERVNTLYREDFKEEEPLTVAWCWPIFFPFNLIVGLRQVHYLSNYFYRKRGTIPPPDPVAEFFPFIQAPNFTWQEFLLTPSLWCTLLENVETIDRTTLPQPIQDFLSIGEEKK